MSPVRTLNNCHRALHWDGPANNQKGINMDKKTISGWALQVTWDDGKEETITEIDDETAGAVDTFLTELEEERATLE